ncbi:RNB domain-containing ribonuclease [Rhodococcus sp. NPDC057135]|uniref:RNB domain-containing ribonuclease n=1 Tax=Rhodococcus sp. NPDC057135 TaxID=3346028 RepID=UPI00363AF5CB
MEIDDGGGQSPTRPRLRDLVGAVGRARTALATALADRDSALAEAHNAGESWAVLLSQSGLSATALRNAIARGLRHDSPALVGDGVWLAIDDEGTRFRDDAIRVRQLPDRRWLVELCSPAVADAVLVDGCVDFEARSRVRVTAPAGRRVGMLPSGLETEWSLAPGFSGSALVVSMILSLDGLRVESTELRRTIISQGQIVVVTHRDADHLLTTGAEKNLVYQSLVPMHSVVQQMTGGGVQQVAAQQIVAEIATAANLAATRWAVKRGLKFLRGVSGGYMFASSTIGAHGQISNPLRRYDSLVNQRVVLAEIEGQPSPYDEDSLIRLGKSLRSSSSPVVYSVGSAKHDLRSFSRAGIHSGRELAQGSRATVDAPISHRSAPTLVLEEFRERRAAGLLSWHDFDLLLSAGDKWETLQEEMIPWMRANRPDIVHELLKNLALRADISIEFEFTRPDAPINTAACACRVLLNGFATEWSVLDADPSMDRPAVQTRKGVRHAAAWTGVQALLGRADYVDIAEDPVFPSILSDLGFDGPPSMFKNLAWRASQSNRPNATFHTEDVSTDDQSPIFRCTAIGLGQEAVGVGYRRGLAKERAAHALLNQIRSFEQSAVDTLQSTSS